MKRVLRYLAGLAGVVMVSLAVFGAAEMIRLGVWQLALLIGFGVVGAPMVWHYLIKGD